MGSFGSISFRFPQGSEMDFPRKGKPTMKKLLFAVSALAALSLLAPSTGLAQATNVLSLYADEAATMNNIDGMAPFSQADIYLVVTNPFNDARGTAIDFLGGVEFAVLPTNALVLSITWPVDVTDVGTGNNHIVGFGQPLAVTDGMATVCTINFLYQSATSEPGQFMLAPTVPASIEGAMAVLDSGWLGDIVAQMPPYESFDYMVFGINQMVATDAVTIDAVKALYR